jgi:hypothetical protein
MDVSHDTTSQRQNRRETIGLSATDA